MSKNKANKSKKDNRGRPRKHGGYVFMKTGILPERMTHIRIYLSNVRERLIHDIAEKESGLTAAQQVLIDRTITLIGVCRCIEEYVKHTGVFVDGKLEDSLGTNYISFQNAVRLNLDKLGIEKRSDEVLDLNKYIEEKDNKRGENNERH